MKVRIPYWQLLAVPVVLVVLGSALNALVMAANNGMMPVIGPLGCEKQVGFIHSCMTEKSRLKFLADWIVIPGEGIASPGDYLVWAYQDLVWLFLAAWFTLVVRDHNQMRKRDARQDDNG